MWGQLYEYIHITLFVCFRTKDYLELVSEVNAASLRCFVSYRGKLTEIFSDCGTNFVGANDELPKPRKDSGVLTLAVDHLGLLEIQ